jgi:quercetin dioxygenase-like cupin family protein
MRTKLLVIGFALSSLFFFQSQAQTADSGFPKGELSTAKNHTGNIWLSELNVGDSTFDPSIAMATYDAGAKLDWHIHSGGQVLLITEGTGFYQERAMPRNACKPRITSCIPAGASLTASRMASSRRFTRSAMCSTSCNRSSRVHSCAACS